MDVPRPDVARKKKKKRLIIAGASVLGLILVTVALSRLKPAAVSVDRAAVWVDTVKRGPMLRQVRGLGTLVPEDIRWIATNKEGRVEKIVVRPGAKVEPDTVILELSSPDLEQAALDAQSQATAAEAELTTLRATLQRELLNQESNTAQVHSEYLQAKMEAETNESLKKNGLIADLAYKTSIIKRDELQNRDEIEIKRLEFARDSIEPQLAAKQATVNQLAAAAKLKARDVEALHVKAGMTGVLQQLPVEVGQRVVAGTNLARVADPAKLKAQIKIAETQAKDIQINQPASIDTRNGVVAGHVTRVDPAVEQGTVTVDIALDGELPKGARPDLSVDGTIELERLDNVLYVGRPAFAQDGATVGVFKLSSSGEAVRSPVHFGRSSVNTIEILSGLNAGEQVILSDTSAYDSHDRIRLN
ncbi:MAG: efflux RND transporter periplasmic adaptor subunit [Verrucomicrobiota bacterium]|nr:efflux RND transporter periplasmic adaptor subunit [Chthoniobacterales bacterium]MDQ3117649.1 efflux RND transporter periplasmic adaptor subunit [Verrucomicrobiota bacterium]MDQ3546093.1 efflux RND transporter periplasmic adaptor subunit [Verrucomicrobiota bacterium]